MRLCKGIGRPLPARAMALSLALLSALLSPAQAQPAGSGLLPPSSDGAGLGTPVNESALDGFDLIVGGSGGNLPAGSGTAAQGEAVYTANCMTCHGPAGEGVSGATRLVGGDMQSEGPPLKTVGSYWPHAVTLFDYVRRAMPADRPKSLSDEEVYQVTAYVLFLNGIVERDFVIDADSLPAVVMPNADGFEDYSEVRWLGRSQESQPAQESRESRESRESQESQESQAQGGSSSQSPALRAQALSAEASITAMQQAMAAGAVTAEALLEAHLSRIAAHEQQGAALNTLIRINPLAREQARALDAERRAQGPRGPLHGIPVILKDNYNTAQMPTTGGSMALIDFRPGENATQVQRLLDAGALIVGKANLHELAYGITTISSLGGQTRNPYDPARVPGGSSGGTAAAVAAGFASFGMGSDTCGSIRIPAAYNNLVGLRPTKGLSSIHGVMPLSTTQDVAGPLARSMADLATVLDVVSGPDLRDPATQLVRNRMLPSFRERLGTVSLDGLRVGVLSDYMESAEPAMRAVLDEALAQMQRQGAELVPFAITGLDALLADSGVIGMEFEADLNAYLAAFGSTAFPDLASIVDSGLYHEAVHGVLTRSLIGQRDEVAYREALAARDTLRGAIEQAMADQQVDVVAYPPITALPVSLGESQPGNLCRLSAHSGLPALSLPAGFTGGGLPVGIELLGPHLEDAWLVALGHAFEQATGWRRSPPL